MKTALVLVLALVVGVYSNCGCLKCNQHLQVLKPRGTNMEIIFKDIPCPCSQSLPYQVQVPGSGSEFLGLCGGIIGGDSLPPKTYEYKVYQEILGSEDAVEADDAPGGGQEYSLNIQIPAGNPASEFNPREIKSRSKVDKVIFNGPLVNPNRPGCPYPGLVVTGSRPQPAKQGCSRVAYRPYYACPNRPRPVYQCSRYENTQSFADPNGLRQDATRETCQGCSNPRCRCRMRQLGTDVFFNHAPRNFVGLDQARWEGSCKGCSNPACLCQNYDAQPAPRNSFVGPKFLEDLQGLVLVQTVSKNQNQERPRYVQLRKTRQGQFLLNGIQHPERVSLRQSLDDVLSMFRGLSQGQTGWVQTCRVCSLSPCQCHRKNPPQLHFDYVGTSPRENFIESRFLDPSSRGQNGQDLKQRYCGEFPPVANFHRSSRNDFQGYSNHDSLRKRFDDVMSYGSHQNPIKRSEVCKMCLVWPCQCSRENPGNSELRFDQTKIPPRPFHSEFGLPSQHNDDQLGLGDNCPYQKDGLQLFVNSVDSKPDSLSLPYHKNCQDRAGLPEGPRHPVGNQASQDFHSNAPTRVNLMPNRFFKPQLDLPGHRGNKPGHQGNIPGLIQAIFLGSKKGQASDIFPDINPHFGTDIPLPKHADQNMSKVYESSVDDKKLPTLSKSSFKSELFGLSLPGHPNDQNHPKKTGLSGLKAINFALPPSFYEQNLGYSPKGLNSQEVVKFDPAAVPDSFKADMLPQQGESNLTKTVSRRIQEGQNVPFEFIPTARHSPNVYRQTPPLDSSSQDKKPKNASFGYSLLSHRLFLVGDDLNSEIEVNHVSLSSTHRPKRSINFRLLATKPENPPRYLRKYHPGDHVSSSRWAPNFEQRAIQKLRDNLRRYLSRHQRSNYVDLSGNPSRNLVGKGLHRNWVRWQKHDQNNQVGSSPWSGGFNAQPRDLHWQTKPKEAQTGFDPHTAQELNLPRTVDQQLLRLPRKRFVLKKPLRLRRAINFKNLEEPKRKRFSKRDEEPAPQPFLTPSSLMNLLGAPLKAINQIHTLGSQVAPIFRSSTKFMVDFLKIFGRRATRHGNTFKRNVRMSKRLPRRRLRRDLNDELRRSLYEATTPADVGDFLSNHEDPQEFLRHTTNPNAWLDGVESDENSPPMVELLKRDKHKRSTNEELSVQIRAIKDRMVQIGSYIKTLKEYDANKDVPIFQKLQELQDLKDALFDAWKGLDSQKDGFKLPHPSTEGSLQTKLAVLGSPNQNQNIPHLPTDPQTEALISKIVETKSSVFKQIVHRLESDPLHQGLWVKILLRLQKLHCALATSDRDFLRNLTLVPLAAPGGVLPELQRRKDLELKAQLGLLKGLREVLGNEDVRERAQAVWQVANVEKLQRDAIADLQRKASAGLQVRRELQIVFDLQKQLDEYQRRRLDVDSS